MNRNRITPMRSMDRGQDMGLQQVLQPSGGQGVSQVRRKTAYTRTELLLRGLPTTQNPRRSPRNRGGTSYNNSVRPMTGPQTPLSQPQGQGNQGNPTTTGTTMPPRQRSFLPRMTRHNQVAGDKSPNRKLHRMRTESDIKTVHGQIKMPTPRMPSTPAASDSSLPGAVLGHRPNRPEGCGIPVLDRTWNRDHCLEQRDHKDHGISDSSRSSSISELQDIKPGKPIRLPADPQNKSFLYLSKPVKKVRELLTARRLRHSCEDLEMAGFGEAESGQEEVGSDLQKTNSEELLHRQAVEQGLELSSITEMSLASSSSSFVIQLPDEPPQLEEDHSQQQQLENHPQQQQLEDHPQQSLEEQPLVGYQERLQSQLAEVRLRQQYLSQQEQRPKELAMVFQNLPTLQHEIRLLQELSEKLEITMRGSNVPNQRSEISTDLPGSSSNDFYTPRSGPMLFQELPIVRLICLRTEHLARITQRARFVAIAHSVAVVREFRIETKTLNELKASDETQCFYLPALTSQPHQKDQPTRGARSPPAECSPPPLQCTNLRMLRENPSMLLQQLRCCGGGGGGGGAFNLLDNDMYMFINNLCKKSQEAYLYSSLSVGLPAKGIASGSGSSGLQELGAKKICEQADGSTQTEKPEEQKITPTTPPPPPPPPSEAEVAPPAATALVKRKRKFQSVGTATRKARKIKVSPIQSNVEPKVRMKLFKTVLVGLVQIGVFLVLFMAFTYPEVSC